MNTKKLIEDIKSLIKAIEENPAEFEALTKAKTKALSHPTATSEHIDSGLKDKDASVRRKALKHPNATAEHIDSGLNDKDASVREKALKHPTAVKTHHIDKALTKAKVDEGKSPRDKMKAREARAKDSPPQLGEGMGPAKEREAKIRELHGHAKRLGLHKLGVTLDRYNTANIDEIIRANLHHGTPGIDSVKQIQARQLKRLRSTSEKRK